MRNWRKASEADGESWQEELHDSCRLVLDVIKAKGGRVKESSIVESLKAQGLKGSEINIILFQLAELNIISLNETYLLLLLFPSSNLATVGLLLAILCHNES